MPFATHGNLTRRLERLHSGLMVAIHHALFKERTGWRIISDKKLFQAKEMRVWLCCLHAAIWFYFLLVFVEPKFIFGTTLGLWMILHMGFKARVDPSFNPSLSSDLCITILSVISEWTGMQTQNLSHVQQEQSHKPCQLGVILFLKGKQKSPIYELNRFIFLTIGQLPKLHKHQNNYCLTLN